MEAARPYRSTPPAPTKPLFAIGAFRPGKVVLYRPAGASSDAGGGSMAKDQPATDQRFAVTRRNRVARRPMRGVYDKEAVYGILDSAIVCHIAYVIDGQPYCTPTS